MSGLVMLAVLAYDGTRRRAVWFLVAVALAALTKFTAFEAVGAAVVNLVGPTPARTPSRGQRATRRRWQPPPPIRASLLTAATGLATFVVSFLWGLRLNLTATEAPDASPLYGMLHAEHIDWGSLVEPLLYVFYSPATGNWQPAFLSDPTNGFVSVVTAGLLGGAVIAAARAALIC